MWNRWAGKAGSEKLVAGWANCIPGKDGGIHFRGVEDEALLNWPQAIRFEVSTTKLTLHMPGDLGSKSFAKSTPDELWKAASAPTR